MSSRLIALVLLAATLSACAGDTRSRATIAQQDACRKRADEVFNRQNPTEAYRADQYVSSQRDTPFSASVSDPTATLSSRHSYYSVLDTCMRNATAQPNPAPPAAAP